MVLSVLLQSIYYPLLLLQFQPTEGAYSQPTAYTFPDGLQSVNGSSSTGGCQPESCVMMPIAGTAINGCDCPGSAPASGAFIDGVIPSINPTQQGWASELFVVNRNGQDSFMIGFQFSNTVPLAYVEIVHFDCPIWGIGISAVNVYSSNIFPAFVTAASTNIGQLSLAKNTDQRCTSLRTISISLQQTSLEFCFIEFTFGGSSTRPINRLYLAEIRFSNMVPTTDSITSESVLVSTIPTTLPESTPATNLPVTTILGNIDSTTGDVSTVMVNTTESDRSSSKITVSTNTDMPPVGNAAIPVPVFVGTLVGVIAFLTLLAVTVAIIIGSCVYMKWKQGGGQSADHRYDYVTEMGRGNSRATSPIEMKANEAYGTHQQDNNTILETPSTEAQEYEELPC